MADRIGEFLSKRGKEGLLRRLKPASLRRQGKIYFDKKEYIDFSSNDYLGLSGHPKIIEAIRGATDEFGTASSASRLLSGDLQLHHRLEEKVAEFKNKEAALIFNSGYQANVGIISALFCKDDCIFSDRLNHASIIDGIILSGARLFRFRHNDMEHLESLIKKERAEFNRALIITETVFSMDGDRAPLKDVVRLKKEYDCQLMIDEAHATGIFGKNGTGLAEEAGAACDVDLIMGTFSKALAGFGAYLAASRKIIDYLINTSRSFIYSTALPPAVIAGNLASIDLIKEEPYRRAKLLECAQYFRDELRKIGLMVIGDSQIIPLIIGDNTRTLEFSKKLQEKGYWVLPIRTPTVPENEARLRFSLSFNHSRGILEGLINDISNIKI